ncbi:hypothetical protein N7478_005013 [Penicillium angulare]|uniref:uncharacterized protein n=1 Tax=Penicillium angulare TaxID=116970 RepID=UPI00254012ED|nr:uncharacterized protein N7478_005013 [Penicillium angulare]KAJ5279641.1 hypothetical protein N7478_005013 [Penicillium angulare]
MPAVSYHSGPDQFILGNADERTRSLCYQETGEAVAWIMHTPSKTRLRGSPLERPGYVNYFRDDTRDGVTSDKWKWTMDIIYLLDDPKVRPIQVPVSKPITFDDLKRSKYGMDAPLF